MGLVERLKRTVLTVLGIRPRRDRTGEPTDGSVRTDHREEPAGTSDVEAEVSGSEVPVVGEESTPGLDAEAETGTICEEDVESAEGEGADDEDVESDPDEASEKRAEDDSEEHGEEEDSEEVDEPDVEEDSPKTDADDSVDDPVLDAPERDTATEEEVIDTEGVESGFEFGVSEDEPWSPDSEPGVEPEGLEDESEDTDEEPESEDPASDDLEDEPEIEESPSDTTDSDEVEQDPGQDSIDEASRTDDGEPEEAEPPEPDETASDLSEDSDGEPAEDSTQEVPDIDIDLPDIEPAKSRTSTTERRIPRAYDLDGNEVHVDDAEPDQTYICPECEGPVELRTSDKIRNHFAHEWGWLDTHDCPLGSSTTSSEAEETDEEPDTDSQRQLPVIFGRSTRSILRLYGQIPALELDDFDDPASIQAILENIQIDIQGTDEHPRPGWFSPANSQVDVGLDPAADGYRITVDSEDRFDRIDGSWTANGLAPGDVFVGERARAERVKTEWPVVQEGQWVYVVLKEAPESVPESAEIFHAGPRDVLGVEVNEDTLDLLQEYADVVESSEATFTTAILLPSDVDPRTDTVSSEPGTEVLIGIHPTSESDPEVRVVVPGDMDRNTALESTGNGVPRFYASAITRESPERRDILGPGNDESIALVPRDDQEGASRPWTEDPIIGVHVADGESQLLDPIRGPTSRTFGPDIDANAITSSIAFEGPEGHRFDLKAEFPDDVEFASVVRQSEVTAEDAQSAISTWIREGCDRIYIDFDAAGRAELVFDRELDCRVVLEAGVTVHDVDTEKEAFGIAFNIIAGRINPDLGYVDIDVPDGPCPHCGEKHEPAFVAAHTALVRLELTMDVFGVENTTHAERIAKAEIGKHARSIPLKTVEVERL